MTSISVTYIPREYRAFWLFPGVGSVFTSVISWDWSDDDAEYPLDMTTHDDWVEV